MHHVDENELDDNMAALLSPHSWLRRGLNAVPVWLNWAGLSRGKTDPVCLHFHTPKLSDVVLCSGILDGSNVPRTALTESQLLKLLAYDESSRSFTTAATKTLDDAESDVFNVEIMLHYLRTYPDSFVILITVGEKLAGGRSLFKCEGFRTSYPSVRYAAHCRSCGSHPAPLTCTACSRGSYCSAECRTSGFPHHKEDCAKWQIWKWRSRDAALEAKSDVAVDSQTSASAKKARKKRKKVKKNLTVFDVPI